MSRPIATGVLLLAVLVTGCSSLPMDSDYISCHSDNQCGAEQVCFPEGCGDPGQNIVVEVVPNPKGGLHAQDFRVDALRSEQNIELFDQALLQGQVRVEATSSSSIHYTAPITLRLTGESLLIPGVLRRHESTLTPENGGYTLPVGAGNYTVTLLTPNTELPPISAPRDVQVHPGRLVTQDFLLPALSALLRLSGKVVGSNGLPLDVELEAQALDENQRPLSQRVAVTRDTGELSLVLPPSALLLPNVLLQVVPTSADILVPKQTFIVNPRQGIQQPLSMGDFGTAVTVRGKVTDQNGQPVPQATVYLQGKVGGGGQYSSRKVLTDATGGFELPTLPSAPDAQMTLFAAPPPGSAAGLTLKPVTVPRGGTPVAQDVKCGTRMKVRGQLLQPSESQPAPGVRVVVESVGEHPGWPRPSFTIEAPRTTDDQGQFEIALDPGQYRFDFIPTDGLPRVSRFVTVPPGDGTPVGSVQQLTPFPLSKGRRVSGLVSISGQRMMQPAAPYASVRFFRVVNVEGRPWSLLLAQTLTDQNGTYSTTLPTR